MLVNKATQKIVQTFNKLPKKFSAEECERFGIKNWQQRNCSVKELKDSINAYAQGNPEIAKFAKEMEGMDPKTLGLAHDVIELSEMEHYHILDLDIAHMRYNNGDSVMGRILSMLPEVGQENPAAIDLAQSVVNHTDVNNAKFFLMNLFEYDLANTKIIAPNMKAIAEFIPNLAKKTLSGSYIGSFAENMSFFNTIQSFCRSNVKPENIKILNSLVEMVQNICKKTPQKLDTRAFLEADTKVIRENLKDLPEALRIAEEKGKVININEFLTKNVDKG